MSLTKKGKKIKSTMEKHYGKKKGREVFEACIESGKITGTETKRKKVK